MKLNVEQRKLVQSKPSNHMLIKGVAGSGKTTIAVHKIPFLLNNYCYASDDNILLVTYNKTLVNYIDYLYSKVENIATQISMLDMIEDKNDKVTITTIDSIIYKYFSKYKTNTKFKLRTTYDQNILNKTLTTSIITMQKKYPTIKLLSSNNLKFISDEINWIKSCNYLEMEEYQNVDRIGRMIHHFEGPSRLTKDSEVRHVIFELMLLYDENLKKLGYIDGKTSAILALEEVKTSVSEKYTHIIIDESQDLTKVQIEFLKVLYNKKDYSSFCFVSDTAQSIYPHAWLVKGRSFRSLGFNMTGKSNSLSKNYRTTAQIAKAAYSLLEHDKSILEDENFVKPSLIDRNGEYPIFSSFKDEKDELEFIKTELSILQKQYKKSEIAIIAKTNNQIQLLERYLTNSGIDSIIINYKNSDFEGDSIKLLTMHSVKGLEFKVVFMCAINDNLFECKINRTSDIPDYFETRDRKLLYVGMTRANELLYLTSSKKTSNFVFQINPFYLRLNSKSKMKKYYAVQIDNYKFNSKIFNIYSNEEKIRQWIISEIINTYHYPEKLIDIEFKVKNFSQTGLVDIVISIYKNNIKYPYIFIEAKSYNQGLDDGLMQLKSYMNVDSSCQYGVITDGVSIKFINKKYELINDIPVFQNQMLPTNLETYLYIDFRNNQKYILVRDPNTPENILVTNETQNIDYKITKTTTLNIYGQIKAGIPQLAIEELDGSFTIPSSWLTSDSKYFFLKVVGDSMEGANINFGDYVLVKSQNTAENFDIVVVTIGDDCTLKKFTLMGSTVLLLPENPNYEPIQMNSSDVIINGIVIGVLKLEK